MAFSAPHVLAMIEDGSEQTSDQQRAAKDRAREIEVMSGAVRPAPSHKCENVKRLGHVREYHDDDAGYTEMYKSRRCRTSAHAPGSIAHHRVGLLQTNAVLNSRMT